MWEGRSVSSNCRLQILHLSMSCWVARYDRLCVVSGCLDEQRKEILNVWEKDDVICLILDLKCAGPRCNEDVNECKKNPCKNAGHCINSQGSYTCECQPGYSGPNCLTDIDDCSPSESAHIYSPPLLYTPSGPGTCAIMFQSRSPLETRGGQKGKGLPESLSLFLKFFSDHNC